jgi:hypothetical protein
MRRAMTELQFTSNEGDGYRLFPSVQLKERSKPSASEDDLQFTLPAALCGLEEPTLHESLGVLRFLAFRLACVLDIASDGELLAWYQSYYADTTIDDYLEVATALLAALRIDVVSTSKTGEITVDFSPIVEDLEQFFLDEFVPIAHYLRVANPDGDEDFEYDFDDAFIGGDALKKIYSFVNFYKTKRIIDLDSLLQEDQESGWEEVVAVRINGISTLQPKRELTQPMDRVLLSIIGVLQFLGYSSEYGELYDGFNDDEGPTLEQLEVDRDEYIEEFPEEKEYAHERFNDRAHGEVKNFEFIMESAAFHTLGITSITEIEDGSFRATLVLSTDLFDCLRKFGFCEQDDYEHRSPFVFVEPVGPVSLGWYEYVFFTPDDDEEDSDG